VQATLKQAAYSFKIYCHTKVPGPNTDYLKRLSHFRNSHGRRTIITFGNMLKDKAVICNHFLSMRSKINPRLPNICEGLRGTGKWTGYRPQVWLQDTVSVDSNDVTKALTNAN